MSAASGEEADAYALSDGPPLHAFAEPIDLADHFMAGNPRPGDRENALDGRGV